MEFEEACIILDAPDGMKAAITKEYKITCREAKQAALSDLKEAEDWLQTQLKYNGSDWWKLTKDTETYNETVKDSIKRLEAANATLNEANRRSLFLKEVRELANNMHQIGFNEAILAFFKYTLDEAYRQTIISKANAIGTIKEKIDYIKGFHGVDKKGNIVPW